MTDVQELTLMPPERERLGRPLYACIQTFGWPTIWVNKEIIYIGNDLPDEYTGSNYTAKLKGALAKAKANAAQGIPEMIEISGESGEKAW